MRSRASFPAISLWFIGTLAGLYVLGAVIYYFDHQHGYWLLSHSPVFVTEVTNVLYYPLFAQLLRWFPMMYGFPA